MRTSIFSAAIASFAVFAAPTLASTVNLITNGSFEEPEVSGAWRVYQDDEIAGWTVQGGAGAEIQTNSVGSVLDTPFGTQYLELDSDTGNGGTNNPTNSSIGQELDLAAGTYKFSFWYSPRTNSADDNDIRFTLTDFDGPDSIFDYVVKGPSNTYPRGEWTKVETTFTLTDTDNPYLLVFSAEGTENTLGGLVDNVHLSQIPVPASGLLLVAGIGGFAAMRARKKA